MFECRSILHAVNSIHFFHTSKSNWKTDSTGYHNSNSFTNDEKKIQSSSLGECGAGGGDDHPKRSAVRMESGTSLQRDHHPSSPPCLTVDTAARPRAVQFHSTCSSKHSCNVGRCEESISQVAVCLFVSTDMSRHL
ncbi:hypothetical protein ASPCADRAFT_129039 [Aspergillus carbonarius ITEM 5010]|uniref:Uncharacterized protein n=1 Tax=Aspergillus carbonarius (strain ITEM 5010) TaxID=602072 RepID=A0A1R3RS90_ASPC5|nr:hypothetical protein ASPCADRAFT_129039 [Aspergillus carbonarius ITEM 5010]